MSARLRGEGELLLSRRVRLLRDRNIAQHVPRQIDPSTNRKRHMIHITKIRAAIAAVAIMGTVGLGLAAPAATAATSKPHAAIQLPLKNMVASSRTHVVHAATSTCYDNVGMLDHPAVYAWTAELSGNRYVYVSAYVGSSGLTTAQQFNFCYNSDGTQEIFASSNNYALTVQTDKTIKANNTGNGAVTLVSNGTGLCDVYWDHVGLNVAYSTINHDLYANDASTYSWDPAGWSACG